MYLKASSNSRTRPFSSKRFPPPNVKIHAPKAKKSAHHHACLVHINVIKKSQKYITQRIQREMEISSPQQERVQLSWPNEIFFLSDMSIQSPKGSALGGGSKRIKVRIKIQNKFSIKNWEPIVMLQPKQHSNGNKSENTTISLDGQKNTSNINI